MVVSIRYYRVFFVLRKRGNEEAKGFCIQNTGILNKKWLKYCQFHFDYDTIKQQRV